jgi:hypothetical protein
MDWPHKSHEDLLAAGFLCRGRIPCPACGAQIAIYQKPNQMPVFVDPETSYPHLELVPHHMDPPWQPPTEPIDGKSAAAGRDE